VINSKDLFGPQDEQLFKQQFVAQFLATYCAVNYAEFCATGRQDELGNPPTEDAADMAETAWQGWMDMFGGGGYES
jgi:hypothetical protein